MDRSEAIQKELRLHRDEIKELEEKIQEHTVCMNDLREEFLDIKREQENAK